MKCYIEYFVMFTQNNVRFYDIFSDVSHNIYIYIYIYDIH